MFREGLVEFCDVGGVVFVVMDFHRFGVDEGFERVVIVAEGWNLVGFCWVLGGDGVGLRADGERAGGQSEGFQTFTTSNHSGVRFYHGIVGRKGAIRWNSAVEGSHSNR